MTADQSGAGALRLPPALAWSGRPLQRVCRLGPRRPRNDEWHDLRARLNPDVLLIISRPGPGYIEVDPAAQTVQLRSYEGDGGDSSGKINSPPRTEIIKLILIQSSVA